MNVEVVSTMISSIGFPIAACIFMACMYIKQTEAHKEEMAKMSEAVNELKLAINSLVDKLKM